MRKSFVALLLLVGVAALTANAFAQASKVDDNGGLRLTNTRTVSMAHSRAAAMGVSAQTAISDTVYVGYSNTVVSTPSSNYWSVGAAGGHTSSYAPQPTNADGKPRPGPNSGGVQNNTNGLWTWDHPVRGDSLQGWWPIRLQHLNISGLARTDNNRLWWASSFGNEANYVINEAHVPVPFAPALQEAMYPKAAMIADAARRLVRREV